MSARDRHGLAAIDAGRFDLASQSWAQMASQTLLVKKLDRLPILQFGTHRRLSLFVNLDSNQVGATTDGTVFGVFLPAALAKVDWHHDVFAA